MQTCVWTARCQNPPSSQGSSAALNFTDVCRGGGGAKELQHSLAEAQAARADALAAAAAAGAARTEALGRLAAAEGARKAALRRLAIQQEQTQLSAQARATL